MATAILETTGAKPATKPLPAKAAKASRKKASTHETHGALPPPSMNMARAFGISDGYDVDSLEDYSKQIEAMTNTELHDHAHTVGIVPLDPRDKLTASLQRKFQETKLAQRGPRSIKVKTNPAMAPFMKRFMAGELT